MMYTFIHHAWTEYGLLYMTTACLFESMRIGRAEKRIQALEEHIRVLTIITRTTCDTVANISKCIREESK